MYKVVRKIMPKINAVNLITLNEETKKYDVASPITLNKTIVWDNPKSESLYARYKELSTDFKVENPNSITRFYVDGWLIESDEYNNISLYKKVPIDSTFITNENKTKLTSVVKLPEYLLSSNSYEVIQCTNGTTDDILQHCIISANPVRSGTYINAINVSLFKTTMVDVDEGKINIFDDEVLQNGDSYSDQYIYLSIKGNTIIR